ncbi:MAG: hypothetical protein O7D94_02070, partial [Planctomycetota bacterium]|nr:hypothetical protein [Planctomycetota bacterium]
MTRHTATLCAAVLCFGITGYAVAQETTFLDEASQGEGNKGTSFRPVDSTGAPAFFELTARAIIDPGDPFNPDALGPTGTVFVDTTDKGTGVQNIAGGGSKGISGGGPNQDEELIFTFDGPIPASSVILDLNEIEFEGIDNKDDPVLFLSVAGSGIFGLTVQETEIENAFTSTGDKRGRIDFALLASLTAGLQIDAFKIREIKGHITVTKIVNAVVPPDGACCHDCDGSCVVTTEEDCGPGNTYRGDGTVCSPNPCPPTGACCLPDNSCQDVTEACCSLMEGDFFPNTDCTDPTLPCNLCA